MFGTALKHFVLIILLVVLIHISLKNMIKSQSPQMKGKNAKTVANAKNKDKEEFSNVMNSPDLDDFFKARVLDKNDFLNVETTRNQDTRITRPSQAVPCSHDAKNTNGIVEAIDTIFPATFSEICTYGDEKVMNGGELLNGVTGFVF